VWYFQGLWKRNAICERKFGGTLKNRPTVSNEQVLSQFIAINLKSLLGAFSNSSFHQRKDLFKRHFDSCVGYSPVALNGGIRPVGRIWEEAFFVLRYYCSPMEMRKIITILCCKRSPGRNSNSELTNTKQE
jgi:hypothetical protein